MSICTLFLYLKLIKNFKLKTLFSKLFENIFDLKIAPQRLEEHSLSFCLVVLFVQFNPILTDVYVNTRIHKYIGYVRLLYAFMLGT